MSAISSQPLVSTLGESKQDTSEYGFPDMSLLDITEGENERKIPIAKFIDDVGAFCSSFTPVPASAELLIGAYTELHAKYKSFEVSLTNKQQHLKSKVPELEKSLTLVQTLLQKQEQGEQHATARYSLADNIYATAELDFSVGTVNLWLGANVMLEYTYQEALNFLTANYDTAVRELKESEQDLACCRDQIVTSEVTMSRIFNWDVRRKRQQSQAGNKV